jgi:hypothetical protein
LPVIKEMRGQVKHNLHDKMSRWRSLLRGLYTEELDQKLKDDISINGLVLQDAGNNSITFLILI